MFELNFIKSAIFKIIHKQEFIDKIAGKNISDIPANHVKAVKQFREENITELEKIQNSYIRLTKKTGLSLMDKFLTATNIVILIIVIFHFGINNIINFWCDLNDLGIHIEGVSDQLICWLIAFMFLNIVAKSLTRIFTGLGFNFSLNKNKEKE